MTQSKLNKTKIGFTLIEMLLVLVIISAIIVMGAGYLQQRTLSLRIDRTSAQMQQILNAALAYYVVNNQWPASLDCLEGKGGCTVQYLPANLLNNPFGQIYKFPTFTGNAPLFSVYTSVTSTGGAGTTATAPSIANIIAGRLPLSYTTKKWCVRQSCSPTK